MLWCGGIVLAALAAAGAGIGVACPALAQGQP